MKAIIIQSLLFFFPFVLTAQVLDTVAINRQVDSLIQISRTLTGEQNFDKALEVNALAENLAMEKLGSTSSPYGNACFNHGRIRHFKGDYSGAEHWYKESLTIFKNKYGDLHIGYATSLNNLLALYRTTGDYRKAETLYLQTKSFRKQALGKTAPEYAYCFHGMAALLFDMNKYELSEPLFRNALSIYQNTFGKEHSLYARCLNGLALLSIEMGKYEKAESLYLETLGIQEKTLGKEHSEYALSLHNLANLYLEMGNYEKAELLYQTVNNVWKKELGKEHPYYALCLDNMATVYLQTRQYEKAEPLYHEALSIQESISGKDHPDYALNLQLLAVLHERQGSYKKAEPLYVQAKTIYEESLGKNHPEYANCVENQGYLYLSLGHYKKAEPLFREAFKIRERTIGTDHPGYLYSLQNFSELYTLMGDEKQASAYFTQASMLQQSLLTRAVLHLSEQELNQFQQQFQKSQARMFSYGIQLKESVYSIAGVCFNDVLFHKGFLLNTSSQVKKNALSNELSEAKFNELKSYERRLAAEYARPTAERKNIVDLKEKANTLEKDLARTVAGFGESMRRVTWQEVQQKLQRDEAAIEFVHFRYHDKKQTDSILYVALLIRPGMEQPQFIPLFEEKSLDSLMPTLEERKADYVQSLYNAPKRGAKAIGKPQKSLYEMLWQPMEKELAGVTSIYFAPTGLLHRINLGAIPIEDEIIFADQYLLTALGSTRQLVVPSNFDENNIGEGAAKQAILLGGIEYEPDTTQVVMEKAGELLDKEAGAGLFGLSIGQRGGTWKYLKWTEREVTNLQPMLTNAGFQTVTHKGRIATEELFKSIGQNGSSPDILHIATHGYFFPDPKAESERGERNERVRGVRERTVFKVSEHPMIRSGLLLAGGNYAWKNGRTVRPNMEDGILTAYEISQMDLSNTELVVLSACETGLGDIQGNEGVYGLQRAFKIAGAKYLIMSLWQVPDFQTQELMTTFYHKYLEEEKSIPDAFRAAQLEMREKYQHPYFWAGFVLVE